MRGRKVCIIIPSRWNSSRFPGKPLADIGGITMIERVYQRCKKTSADDVIVATDDLRIFNHVSEFGKCVMTPEMSNGTQRVCYVAEKILDQFDYFINVQGDEPFIDPDFLDRLIKDMIFFNGKVILTGATDLKSEDMQNRSAVKMVTGEDNEAICFTRSPFFVKDEKIIKHLGIYGFRKSDILDIYNLQPSEGSLAEQLEQIRWLEEGYKIKYVMSYKESVAIDTPDDILKANDLLQIEKKSLNWG